MARTVQIAVIRDTRMHGETPSFALFRKELDALALGRFETRYPEQLQGIVTNGREATKALDVALESPDTDIVVALGTLSSLVAAQRKGASRPVLASGVCFPDIMHTLAEDDQVAAYGVYGKFDSHLRVFKDLYMPSRTAILVETGLLENMPGLGEKLESRASALGVDAVVVPISTKATDGWPRKLPAGTDSVFVAPLDSFDDARLERVADTLCGMGLKSYAMSGRRGVRAGIPTGSGVDSGRDRLARRLALAVERIATGGAVGDLPLHSDRAPELFLNMKTALAVGYHASYDVLHSAVVVREETHARGKPLTLPQAARLAIKANLDVAGSKTRVAESRHVADEARAAALPRVGVGLTQTIIDEDRARASLGQQPERELAASVEAGWKVYSDEAVAGWEAAERQSDATAMRHRATVLDVVAETAVSYLEIQSARTRLRQQRANLEANRANLARARERRLAGMANPSEVYRWQAEIARNRSAVERARAGVRTAGVSLNRVLNRPQDMALWMDVSGPEETGMVSFDPRFARFVDSPRLFFLFVDFMAAKGREEAPELSALRAAIKARERLLVSAERSWWLPEFGVNARWGRVLDENGAGVDPPRLPLPITLPRADHTDWSIALTVEYPLISGGARAARENMERQRLARLHLRHASAAGKIEERVRKAGAKTETAWSSIGLARRAVSAAGRNLELVADAYSEGTVGYVDLVDAQNAHLEAVLAVVDAEYGFLQGMVAMERAASWFGFMKTPAQVDQWFRTMENYYRKRGVDPAPTGRAPASVLFAPGDEPARDSLPRTSGDKP
ncbi:MAG: TolC family protein [Desulfatibacillaceae bacterium]